METESINKMTKEDFILSVLSLIDDISLSPIQLQKLFFLIEKRLGDICKYFSFEPYYYGPYDKELAEIIKKLAKNDILETYNINNIAHYKINHTVSIDNFLDEKRRDYIKKDLTPFIKNKSFIDLCYSIYKEFPEMAERSVLIKKEDE